jgi:hypothetical protein
MEPTRDTGAQRNDEREASPSVDTDLRVVQHTLGRTGRIWSMPASYALSTIPGALPQYSPQISVCVENAVRFVHDHAPEVFKRWMGEMSGARLSAVVNRLTAIACAPRERVSALCAEAPAVPAPTSISLPTLDESHWAWARHYDLGHYVYHSDNLREDCESEARSDLSIISWYLAFYDKLAQDYSGERLIDAVCQSQFRDPYYTCMEICFQDLKLPGHFMSLIHYGMGLYFVQFGAYAPELRPVFQRLVEMYLEDFAS